VIHCPISAAADDAMRETDQRVDWISHVHLVVVTSSEINHDVFVTDMQCFSRAFGTITGV
jgi:hypothetical protein